MLVLRPDLEQLHHLMGMGYTQRDASLALWDPNTPIGNRAAVALAGIRARQGHTSGLRQGVPVAASPGADPVTRRRPRPPARCRHCQTRIRFFRIDRDTWRPFETTPMTGHDGLAADALPVWCGRAWDYHELLIEFVERGPARGSLQAADEVMDLEWYRPHRCAQRAASIRQQAGATP